MTPLYDEALGDAFKDLRASGEPIPAPIEIDFQTVDAKMKAALGFGCDPDYYAFLKTCNGLMWNGLIVYGFEPKDDPNNDIIQNTLVWREGGAVDDYVVYGDNGMDLLVGQPAIEQFHLAMKPSMDIMENYSAFDEMLSFDLNNRL
jgi:hypothetical protein